MSKLHLFIILFLSVFSASGQKDNGFTIQEFNTENGLPSNGIKGLQWDEATGFLWIATEAGIARFNGIDFKNFTDQNTPSILSERMTFMVKNNSGRIYTADLAGNITYINRNKLEYFGKLSPFQDFYYDNRITLSVSDTLFNISKKFNTKLSVSYLYSQILPLSDTSCVISHAGQLYWLAPGIDTLVIFSPAVIQSRGVFKINARSFYCEKDYRIREIFANQTVRDIEYDNSAIPLNKLFTSTARLFWSNGMPSPIILDKNIAWKLTIRENKILPELISTKVPTDALIRYVQYSDKQKTLFIGTESKGVFIISKDKVVPMKRMEHLPNERNAYYAQIELADGNILTAEGHVVGNKTSVSKLPIQSKFGNFLSFTGDSLIWYSQVNQKLKRDNLFKYNRKTRTTTAYPNAVGGELLIRPLPGGQYLSISEHGIGRLVEDSIQYIYRHPSVAFDNAINDCIEIEPGKLLLASCAGILQFDITYPNKLDTLLNTKGHCIRSVWKFGEYLFFGSYGKGFFVWKKGVIKSMPLDKMKYLLYAHCFIPDGSGYCWISTNRGLFKANLNDLINAYETNTPSVYYHYFGKKDGMDMIEMNGGCTPCAIEMKNRTLSFPTMDGLLWVDPLKAEPILPDGQIFIDEITADSMVVNPDLENAMVFPAKTKEISIKLSYSAWCNNENIYVDYQLNDTVNWKLLDTKNEALLTFSNLAPGNYTLRFRKQNGFGIKNYSYKTIQFQIIKPWHQQWWFSLLAAVVLAGVVALYLHFRTRQFKIRQRKLEHQVAEKTRELQQQNEVLEKNNSIKTRLISIISHDIVTPLKFLTVAGKNLLEKKQLMSEALQTETINEITNTSQELQLLSTNILNWIKYQNENRRLTKEVFDLHEMVQQVLGILNSLAQQKNLRVVNEIPPHADVYQFYEPLKIMIYNLLTNAINFSERGEIRVQMKKENNQVIVSVRDEGVGMSPEKVQSLMADHVVISSANVDNKKGHGLGFLIIKDLLKTMGATLNIKSKLGEGSTISIIFPLQGRMSSE
jgi:signal transduction histidine kinase